MRLSPLFALAAVAFALSPLACASDPQEDDNIVTPPEEGSAEDELRAFSVTEADNGKTVTVTEGQNLLVKLKANPSTGFSWKVVSTNRTFGYPSAEKFFPNGGASGPIGSGGIQRFTWKTKAGPMSMVGEHRVKMEYKREWEVGVAAAETFEITVKIVSGECPMLAPPAPGFCPDGEIKPTKGANGCTTGYTCESTEPCPAGRERQWCWGSLQCIPKGAIC